MSEQENQIEAVIQEQGPEAYLAERQAWVREAIEIITGDPTSDPNEVLPSAGQVRADSPGLTLSQEQEHGLREVAGRFGIGGEVDVTSGAACQILEGGKPWKIEAEAAIAGDAATIIFSASNMRRAGKGIDAPHLGQDEVDYMQGKYGVDLTGKTEYDMARVIAESQEGYMALEQDEVLPFGYDIHNNPAFVTEPTGQLVKIGTARGKDVLLLRVDREDFVKDDGITLGYRKQPKTAELMSVVADVLTACGDTTSDIGFNTSNTYVSRAIDVFRAGLMHGNGHGFSVGMYGRGTLAETKGTPAAEPTAINQIPGELHVIYSNLEKLKAELESE